MDNELLALKKLVKENGITTDFDYLKDKRNRLKLNDRIPNAFLGKDGTTPTFPTVGQSGAYSLPVLKKSYINAKRMYLNYKTPDKKYLIIMQKIQDILNGIERKRITVIPVEYDGIHNSLKNILNSKRELSNSL